MNLDLEIKKLSENPMTRIPIVLILDNSSSMIKNNTINLLNNEISKLFDLLKKDEILAYSAEIAVVSFEFDNKTGNTRAKKILDFEEIENQAIPKLKAFGKTPLGGAVNLSLDLFESRKDLYKKAGIDYYQPMLIILTDGEPTDNISFASKKCKELILNKKLSIYPIGIGEEVHLSTLQNFTHKRLARKIEVKDLPRLFEWIYASIERTSESNFNFDETESINEKYWFEI